jgi:hypothetical protein
MQAGRAVRDDFRLKDAVDDREKGGVGADAEREGEDGNDAESWGPCEHAQGRSEYLG